MASAAKRNVVVIGGGAAGTDVARELSTKLDASKYDLVLVTPRPFSVWLPALVRAVVTSEGNLESLEKGALVPYDRMFKSGNGTVKIGVVSSIEPKSGDTPGAVILEGGERIPYAALVVASGSTWADPVNLPNTKAEVDTYLDTWRSNFQNANHVLLVGGGAVGIEIAGELRDLYPEKPITIVQGSTSLLNKVYPDSFRQRLVKDLEARSVTVILEDYVDEFPSGGKAPDGITTRKGKHIPADFVISTRGSHPNTSFLKSSGFQLMPSGTVSVEPTLQAKGHPDVFAIGDIIDWEEQKQSAKVHGHVSVAVANVLDYLEGKEPTAVYSGANEVIIVTNGKNGGAAYFAGMFGLQLGAWFVRMIKGDLFVGQYRKGLGY